MIPECESALSLQLDPFFKIFRDDGLGVVFGDPSVIPKLQSFFNGYNNGGNWL